MWFMDWFSLWLREAWTAFLALFGLCLVLVVFTGCSSVKSWDAEVVNSDTHWNWGIEVGSTFYIGPVKGSTTDLKFVGKAEGGADVEDTETPTPD